MTLEDFNLCKEDAKYLVVLFVLVALCFIKYIQFIMPGGLLNVDSALYLVNSLKYAGMDYYNIVNPADLYFTPVISFLTSLLFRMGLVDKLAIAIVTMTISFAGYFGLYILFKYRFNSLLSFTGVIIFGCLSVVIFNMPQGMIDLPVIAICIWTLVFAIAAIDKNPKYFLIVFPLLTIGFFTKYIAGFVLPLILLYYLMRRNFIENVDCMLGDFGTAKKMLVDYLKSAEFKYIIISLIIALILAVVICKTLILDYGGSLRFFEQSFNTFNGHESSKTNRVYFPERSHYIKDLPTILFQHRKFGMVYTYVLYAFIGFGVAALLANVIKNRKTVLAKGESFKTRHFSKILAVLFVAFAFASFYGFKYMSNNMFSNISLLAAMAVLYSLLRRYAVNEDKLSFDILMIAYFAVYFIFLSLYQLKVRRYAMPFLPAFVFFTIWGLNSIMDSITNGFSASGLLKADNRKRYSKIANAIPIVVVLVLVVSTAMFLAPQQIDRSNDDFLAINYHGYVNDLRDVCDFIKENDSDYHSKTFASFSSSARPIKWYLNTNVTVVKEDSPKLKDYDNATYIILNENRTFNNYHVLFNKGDYTLYVHN